MVKQYEVYWINLAPTVGHEIKKTRPGVIISPDELNNGLGTVLVAPVTSTQKSYPFRPDCQIAGKTESIALDQIRCIDKTRLVKKMDRLDQKEISNLKGILEEMLIK